MSEDKPLIKGSYLLQKMQVKGGWTYVVLQGIPTQYRQKGGGVLVRGSVDGVEVKHYNLFPLKNQPTSYFFAINAGIRKQIKKEEGDYVNIVLYANHNPVDIEVEFRLCLEDSPEAYAAFKKATDEEQRLFVNWIVAANNDETKVDRITRAIIALEQGKSFQNK